MKTPTTHLDGPLGGKTCLVTGANRGIGRAIGLGLAQRGATVVAVCRDPARGAAAVGEIISQSGNADVHLLEADLSSQASNRHLAETFRAKFPRLDVLVNNAGVVKRERTLTVDGLETTLAVNHLAPFLLTHLLLDCLTAAAPSRIIVTSSLVHKWGRINFDDLQGEHHYDMDRAYNQSKLANVLFTYELARRLRGTGVTANTYEPGMTLTDFGHEYTGFKGFMSTAWRPFMVSPEKAAETAIYLASSPNVTNVTGSHFVRMKPVRSSPATYDEQLALRLWEVSQELVETRRLQPVG
jgi:NAD(P)-dependent dehydrogenase (short-subunit alcohol dehydrogenase family)